jgi:GAF domain-containing protein
MNDQKQTYQQLLELSAKLAGTMNSQEIEKAAVSLIPQAFSAACCALVRLGPEREKGQIPSFHPPELSIDPTLTREESLAFLPFLNEESSQVVQRGDENPALEQLLQRLRVQSALIFPLQTEETFPPFLVLGFAGEPFPQNSEALLLWEQTGRQIAAALRNALLYRQTYHRLQELRLLHEVAMATSTTVNLDQILHRVVDAVCHSLSPDVCGFLNVNEEKGILEGHPSSRGFPYPPKDLSIPLGNGATSWVVQTGQALYIPDVADDPRYITGGIEGMRSELAVPIQVGGKIVAVLNLESRQPNAFKGEDLRLISTVASQLAVAIERTQLFQQSQQRVRELTALMRTSTTMQKATRLQEILDVILMEAFSFVGQDHGSVLLLDPEEDRLYIAASQGLPEDLVKELNEKGIPITFGTFETVLRTGQILEIADTTNDPRVESGYGPIPPQLTNVPLKTEKGIIGILVLDAIPSDDTSRRLLQSMVSMAAMAIERAWLFEETQRRLEEIRFLQEVAMAATSTLDFDEVLRRSVESLQRWLDFEVFGFLIVDEWSGMLRLHPTFVGIPEELHGFEIPIGEGITGWVAQTGKPYLASDVRNDPHYYDAISEIRSEMCVPVKVGDRVIAIIDMESVRPNAFGPNELRLLSSMAHQMAVALQNARLYEREQRQHRLAEAMRQAAIVLGATANIDDLLDQALAHLESLLTYDAAFLLLLQGDQVEKVHNRHREAPPETQWLAPATLGDRVHKAHRAIVVPDVRKEALWQPWTEVEDLLSWIGVPLLSKEEIAGMLLVGAKEANAYNREEATLVFSFASQLTLGIERAHSYEQERRRAEQLDLLYTIGQRVVGIIDLKLLQEETIRCIQDGLQPQQSLLALLEGEHLVIHAASSYTERGDLPPTRLSLEESSLLCWVARKEMPLLVPDITADPRFQTEYHADDARAEMAVPLRTKNQVIGILHVQGSQPNQFDESDLSTLQAIASLVSGAIERARLYTELQESVRQLQETDQLRRDVLSTINHEMRAPLTAILGFTDFLLRQQAGPLTQSQEEYLGDIRAAGERILNLVENILEAARLEEGQVVPRCTEVQIAHVVARTRAMIQPAAMEKALTLEARISDDLPAAWADPMMVERILINLLQNAVKFTPPGGSVWVTAKRSEKDSDMLEISVRDTGIGIDPKDFDSIFQRYRRLETPAVGQVSGTGLGLYIVQGLVHAHRGRIWVESALGQGSTFTFTLSTEPPKGSQQPTSQS